MPVSVFFSFALPDLRSRAPIHAGTGPGLSTYPLGSRGGQETVTLTTDQIPSHTHGTMCMKDSDFLSYETGYEGNCRNRYLNAPEGRNPCKFSEMSPFELLTMDNSCPADDQVAIQHTGGSQVNTIDGFSCVYYNFATPTAHKIPLHKKQTNR